MALVVLIVMTVLVLTLAVIRHERSSAALHERLVQEMARDIERSIARLDRLSRDERPAALRGLERANFRILLGGAVEGPVPDSGDSREFARRIVSAIHPFRILRVAQVPYAPEVVRIEVGLSDGMAVIVHARRLPEPLSWWVIWSLIAQMLLISACVMLADRRLARPIGRLIAPLVRRRLGRN